MRTEINEGRLYLESNKVLLKEESAWHILGIHGWNPPQGTYESFARFLIAKPKYSIMGNAAAQNPHVSNHTNKVPYERLWYMKDLINYFINYRFNYPAAFQTL